jgi:hypothetical protein
MSDELLTIWDWVGRNAGAITALVALFVAAWSAYSSRRHNRLSVRPELMQYTNASETDLSFRLGVRNSGLGPARILSFGITHQNQLIQAKSLKDLHAFLSALLQDVSNQIVIDLLHQRYVMPKDEKHDVLVIRFRDVTPDKAREVLARLRKLDVAIEFESLYGQRDALRPLVPGGGG